MRREGDGGFGVWVCVGYCVCEMCGVRGCVRGARLYRLGGT